MIVSCPQCRARYRVREEKLPPGGGNIQCPACSHVFPALASVVSAPSPAVGVSGAPTTMLSQQTQPRAENPFQPPLQTAETVTRPAPSGSGPAVSPFQAPSPAASREGFAARPSPSPETDVTQVVRPSGPEAPGPLAPPRPISSSGPPPVAKEQWKLRSPVGLVYDFPDLTALKTWLSSRDSVDGMSASRDGGVTWELLTAFPELRSALPKAARLALSRSEPAMEQPARTTVLTSPMPGAAPRPASGVQPPAARPSMSSSAPMRAVEAGTPPARHPSASYAMAPPADSPLRREVLTPGAQPTARVAGPPPGATGPSPAATSEPKRPPARPSIRSGGYPSVTGAPSGGSGASPSATGARTSGERRAVAARRGPPARSGGRPAVGRAPRPIPKRAGLGTYLGLLVVGALVVASILQISGLYDVVGALGLRSHSPPAQTIGPPPAESATVAESPTPSTPVAATAPESGLQSESSSQRALQLMDQARSGANPHAARIAVLTSRAREAASDGRIEEAIDLVNNALQFDRTNADTVCLLADLQREAGSLGEAEALEARCESLRVARAPRESEP